jgi:hypothetical protein
MSAHERSESSWLQELRHKLACPRNASACRVTRATNKESSSNGPYTVDVSLRPVPTFLEARASMRAVCSSEAGHVVVAGAGPITSRQIARSTFLAGLVDFEDGSAPLPFAVRDFAAWQAYVERGEAPSCLDAAAALFEVCAVPGCLDMPPRRRYIILSPLCDCDDPCRAAHVPVCLCALQEFGCEP